MEFARKREVISVTEVNFAGAAAAKILQGTFKATARGDSKKEGAEK